MVANYFCQYIYCCYCCFCVLHASSTLSTKLCDTYVHVRGLMCCFSSLRHLVSKMRNVFEQVMLVDGSRRMRGDIIQKTFKVGGTL